MGKGEAQPRCRCGRQLAAAERAARDRTFSTQGWGDRQRDARTATRNRHDACTATEDGGARRGPPAAVRRPSPSRARARARRGEENEGGREEKRLGGSGGGSRRANGDDPNISGKRPKAGARNQEGETCLRPMQMERIDGLARCGGLASKAPRRRPQG